MPKITPHKGGRTDRLFIRIKPELKEQLFELAELNNSTASDIIEKLIQEASMDTNQVYYCAAGGHFWCWQWSSEKGGRYFPAYIADAEDESYTHPDDFIEQYCGCND